MNSLRQALLTVSAVLVMSAFALRCAAVESGQPAPEFTFTDLAGKTQKLQFFADYQNQDKRSQLPFNQHQEITAIEAKYTVTRKGESSGKVYGPGEAVSMKDALIMYTRNGAFLTREEKAKGTLEVGKLADMVVLPEDLLSISPEKLLTMKVDMTIVGGKILHERT